MRNILFISLIVIMGLRMIETVGALTRSQGSKPYDTVILGGRVIDPESGLDAVRNVGIRDGKVAIITTARIDGRQALDARGHVVAPGFIDLHEHGQTPDNYILQAMDGVTSSLELEVGTSDVDGWYAEREGRALVNHGVSVGHIQARMKLMGDPGSLLPSGPAISRKATEAEIAELGTMIARGLDRGAVAVGFGPAYTPGATPWEIQEMFRVAARYNASCHVHLREAREPAVGALQEVIADAVVTGAPLHVVHINSTGTENTPKLLRMIEDAARRGIDVTTECYPYIAGMTRIDSALFSEGFQERLGVDYKDLMWPRTGERLTPESFARYRKEGGEVIIFSNTEEMVRVAVTSPLTMIASDGFMVNGKGHPRTAGTYSQVLGKYVREMKALTLIEALRKMALQPARRLERRAPMMRNKGRLRSGADADIVVFDPERIIDRATYAEPAKYSEGMKYVIVNGVPVVSDGRLREGVFPGRAIRAAIRK